MGSFANTAQDDDKGKTLALARGRPNGMLFENNKKPVILSKSSHRII